MKIDFSCPLLLHPGIFSDIHMLALMYAGELCYWAWLVASTSKKPSAECKGSKAASSDSKAAVTVNATSLAVVDSSMASLQLGEGSKTAESATNSKDTLTPFSNAHSKGTVTPRSEAVQMPTEIATNCGMEPGTSAADKPPLGETNVLAERQCNVQKSSVGSLVSSEVDSQTSLEKTVQDLSLHDHSEQRARGSEYSNCAIDALPSERHLYSVMEHCQGVDTVENWKSRFDPFKRGQELLSKFVEVARGPLKSQGWNYGRAVQLLVAMKKAQH